MRRLSLRDSLKIETLAGLQLLEILVIAIALPGCAGGGASSGTPPPPPPQVSISVTPPTGDLLLGKTLQFSATVSGISNSSVTWSVTGISGGNSALGLISSTGLYTAPAELPSPATVQITAVSTAAPSASGSAQVTVISDISVALTQSVTSVELGATAKFGATIASAGQPDTAVRWTLSGGACPAACGSIDSSGNYTAPQTLPSPATVSVTAQSVADPSKQATLNVTITSHFTLQLTAPGTVSPSATATIVATLIPTPGSNPSSTIHWSLSGLGCSGSSCGTLSSVTTQIQGATTGGAEIENANYTAPGSAPVPNTVTITATPLADPSKKAQATITIQGASSGMALQPLTATLALSHRMTFAVQTSGAISGRIKWSVNGVAGGSASLGRICVQATNPCVVAETSSDSQVDYVAPAALPAANPVTVQAILAADATKFATAQVVILNHVVVSVLPGSVTLAPGATQPFSATALGTTNQNVVWQIQGTGCAAGACGSISAGGLYTAPGAPPVPNSLQVVAISSDDTSQQGTANVTISAGPNLQSLHPASVYAGGALGFVLRAEGGGFVATTSGMGSTLLIDGNARSTSCLSATACTAAVFPSDVAAAGTVAMQVQNPDGSRSNTLALVVVAPNTTNATIALTGAAPDSTGNDIVVVEPTSAGVSLPGSAVDLDIAALGDFSIVTNTCSLGGNPIVLTRPSSGSATFDICVFSQSGLDASMTYAVSGPSEVSVIAKQPAGLGIIHLTLQVQSTAQPGSRTLFIQNLNLDKTAASGVLEVQ